MKLFLGLGLVVAAGVAAFFMLAGKPQPVDDFALPVDQAYAKLSAVRIEGGSKDAVFFIQPGNVSGNGRDKLVWSINGGIADFSCDIGLTPAAKPKQTHVTVTCNGGGLGESTALGIFHAHMRYRVIEMVDATLKGRPFDRELALGETAALWPSDMVEGSPSLPDAKTLREQAKANQARADAER